MTLSMSSNPIRQTPIVVKPPVLKVLGLGGGGCNAINRMIEAGITGVDYIAANTDQQALKNSLAPVTIHLGPKCTRGLGAGGNPAVGEAAAEESYREIAAALEGADMVFLAAGMGGGTGTGSIPIAARVARAIGAVTIAIVTTPFSFEMGRRQVNARQGLAKLRMYTDTLITVPNDRLLYVARPDLTLELAFRLADDVLRQGIQGIAELITETGLINVDFAHIRRLMQMGGGSLMSIGYGEGENKALKAVELALRHPLLDSVDLDSAAGMIVNFTGGTDLTFHEVTEALAYLQDRTGGHADIIFGVIQNEAMQERTQVILIATGLGATPLEQALPGAERIVAQQAAQVPATGSVSVSPAGEQRPRPQPEVRPQVERPAYDRPAMQAQPTTVSQGEPPAMDITGSAATNLDLPAFLRRRARPAGMASA